MELHINMLICVRYSNVWNSTNLQEFLKGLEFESQIGFWIWVFLIQFKNNITYLKLLKKSISDFTSEKKNFEHISVMGIGNLTTSEDCFHRNTSSHKEHNKKNTSICFSYDMYYFHYIITKRRNWTETNIIFKQKTHNIS